MLTSLIPTFLKKYLLFFREFLMVNYEFYFKNQIALDEMFSFKETTYSTLTLEGTSICNAKCIFCAYSKGISPKKTMDIDLFRKIVDDFVRFNQGSKEIYISLTPTVGDPLVDKYFLERLAYLKQNNFKKIIFFTNAIGLTKDITDELLNNYENILDIHISWGGYDRQTYLATMGVDKFDLALDNLLYLIEKKKSEGKSFSLDISSRCSPKDYNGLIWEKFRAYEKEGLVQISKTDMFDNWGGLVTKKDLDKASLELKLKPHKKGACKLLFQSPVVHSSGIVSGCHCRDLNNELMIGDLNSQSYKDIISSAKRLDLINNQQSGNFPRVCENCSTYVSIYNKFWREIGKKMEI